MAIDLNHTIVAARDAKDAAEWYAEMFDLGDPKRFGPFWEVTTANGVDLAFDTAEDDDGIRQQHYAFLITEDEFDTIYGRIVGRGIEHYADPGGQRRGEINHNDGGRGVYFPDPNGHWLEIITRPYGSG